jgi:hypothetical protein
LVDLILSAGLLLMGLAGLVRLEGLVRVSRGVLLRDGNKRGKDPMRESLHCVASVEIHGCMLDGSKKGNNRSDECGISRGSLGYGTKLA